jgi:hypothetical protein
VLGAILMLYVISPYVFLWQLESDLASFRGDEVYAKITPDEINIEKGFPTKPEYAGRYLCKLIGGLEENNAPSLFKGPRLPLFCDLDEVRVPLKDGVQLLLAFDLWRPGWKVVKMTGISGLMANNPNQLFDSVDVLVSKVTPFTERTVSGSSLAWDIRIENVTDRPVSGRLQISGMDAAGRVLWQKSFSPEGKLSAKASVNLRLPVSIPRTLFPQIRKWSTTWSENP